MQCPSCGEQTAEGKFCTNCGAQLDVEQMHDKETSTETDHDSAGDHFTEEQENSTEDQEYSAKNNEAMDKLQTIGSDFGHFFVTLVKNPSEAKKANHTDVISGIIIIVLSALLLAASYHFVLNAIPAGFFRSISFFDSFILPIIIFVLLEFLIAGLTFAGAKLSVQTVTFPDVIAKYGAYLIPFVLLFAAGIIFSLIGISALAVILILISILGLVLFIPTFILLEQPAEGFDRVYVLLVLYIITILAFGFFTQSFLSAILGSLMDSMFGGF
ncbi:zinc ribbon domain-containing protein [Lentibacillus sp. CBA3610]|uniref:zinc ribbon domain-containing protein n=1 Tax=Lentibacillus sp. CBA3610 TaxID=2518176 RepID=UPI001595B42C|nr:zinc ribbon domain-containing protein [Lentibacillus sp. CBA3610]QKY71174.1 hypothetical protein Len3610_17850 [Lentibacillus sp. CBA3610]